MSTPIRRPLAGFAIALLCSARALAQPAVPALDPVTVTGARIEQPLSSVQGDLTVIDGDTITRAGQSSLADLLQREHGIDIASSGGPQTTTGIFLRGANSNQTVFLIDGQRVGSSTAGGAGINAVGLADLERIEILRGPASSLYGADAIGGVVNLITRRAPADTPLSLSGSLGAGTWNTRKANVGLAGATGPWRYSLSLGHARSDGYGAAEPNEPGGLYNPDRDGYRQDHASGRLGFAWREGQELEASFLHSRMTGQYDGSPAFDDRVVQGIESYALASNNRISDRWTSRLRIGRTIDDNVSRYAPSFFDPTGRGAFRTRQTLYSWQNDFALAPGQSLSLAAERREEDVDSNTLFEQTARNTNSLTGVYRFSAAAHHVQANVRYDHVGGYGGRGTGGLSYGYDLSQAWQVTVAGSSGFRLPTFNELYYPGAGNPEAASRKLAQYRSRAALSPGGHRSRRAGLSQSHRQPGGLPEPAGGQQRRHHRGADPHRIAATGRDLGAGQPGPGRSEGQQHRPDTD